MSTEIEGVSFDDSVAGPVHASKARDSGEEKMGKFLIKMGVVKTQKQASVVLVVVALVVIACAVGLIFFSNSGSTPAKVDTSSVQFQQEFNTAHPAKY